MSGNGAVRPCRDDEHKEILAIVNAAAEAYRNSIPLDRWREPYMPMSELEHEISEGTRFWGYEVDGALAGVMGIQPIKDVDLIRHAYVLPVHQGRGVGAALIGHLRKQSTRQMLVVTWAAAEWAIRFYVRHGFELVSLELKDSLLKTYWTIPERQVETSVVLANPPLGAGVPAPRWLRVGFWVCTLIAVAVVVRRIIALEFPSSSGPPQLVELDRIFAFHSALTLAHILPALAFVLIAPFAVLRRFSRLTWPERWLFPLGAIVGITAYAMSVYSIGGWIERSAVLLFNTLFLFSLGRAWQYKVRGRPMLKRRWLIRAIAVLLGIATTRPVMGVFFATSRITHLSPHQFFGIAFWIGFSVNWIIIESWLRFRNQPARA